MTAIIEGDHQLQAAIVAGQRLGLVDQRDDVGLQMVAVADHADLDAVLMQFGKIAADKKPQETHQIADFLGRTFPVFGAEAVEGQIFDAEFAGRPDDDADGFNALPMAGNARQMPLCRPASVAIHDDRDVPRRCAGCGLSHRMAGLQHHSLGTFSLKDIWLTPVLYLMRQV